MSEHTDAQRDAELLANLDPESLRLLFPERFAGALEITLVHPVLEGESATAAAAIAEGAGAETMGEDGASATRVTFPMADVEALHDYYALLEATVSTEDVEILLDGQRVPMVRELWLPLLWLLRS